MTLEPLLGLLPPRGARDNAALGMTRLGGERVVVGAAVRKRGSWREGGRYGPLERHGVVERECEALERDCEGGGLCGGGGGEALSRDAAGWRGRSQPWTLREVVRTSLEVVGPRREVVVLKEAGGG